MTDRPGTPKTSRVMRGVALVGLGILSALVLLGIILWDADIYTARDRYEHLKIALFGDWQPRNWCPPGRETDHCVALNDFETALEDASDFTFFRHAPVEGTELSVHTGIRFATARDVVDGLVASQWCYVSASQGQVSQQIELATQSADEPPTYADLSSLDASSLVWTGLSAEALTGLSHSHCQFD